MSRTQLSIVALLLGFVVAMTLPVTVQAQPGQTVSQKSFKNLIAALSNVNSEIRALKNQDIQGIIFAEVTKMRDNLDESQNQTLDETIEEAKIEALHNFLQESEPLKTAFREKRRDKVIVKDVIAVDMLSDHGVVVYFEPTL